MNKPYVLTKGATADLENIISHSLEQWGKERTLTYIIQLETIASALARGEGTFRDLGAIRPSLRMAKSGSHFIFCLPQSDKSSPEKPALILAILHERMDIMARLKNRLG